MEKNKIDVSQYKDSIKEIDNSIEHLWTKYREPKPDIRPSKQIVTKRKSNSVDDEYTHKGLDSPRLNSKLKKLILMTNPTIRHYLI